MNNEHIFENLNMKEKININQIVEELSGMKEKGWRNFAFNQEMGLIYSEGLVDVDGKLENCTDERQEEAAVSIVGIGGNSTNRAMRLGQKNFNKLYETKTAINFTKQLQEKMGWGPVYVHNDEHFKSGIFVGCAYFDKLHLVNSIVSEVMGFEKTKPYLYKEGVGQEIYQALIETPEVRQTTLKGQHQKNSPLVINEKVGTSIDRSKFEGDNSPFVCDLWIVKQQVVDCYNREFGTQMTVEDLKTEIVFEHLAVLKILGRDLKNNIVHIKNN